MTMRITLSLLAALALSACSGNVRQTAVASFDLGTAAVVWKPATVRLHSVEAGAPSWLAATAIQYRLLYADPLRRQSYTESRWAAPPAELIARALNRQTVTGEGGCRLNLDLDELTQVFDSPQQSRILLDVRASLMAPRGNDVLARKAFSLAHPAPSADARGGVSATAAAVQALGGELGAWLIQTARANPTAAERCKGGWSTDSSRPQRRGFHREPEQWQTNTTSASTRMRPTTCR